jgi:hypothetical protein
MDTKICNKCGKNMIKVGTGVVLTSYPAQYPQKWWCKCGNEEKAETLRGKTEEEILSGNWEDANK